MKGAIELNVAVATAYDQWTQFEDLPKFMDGVREIKQLDDKRLHRKPPSPAKKKNGMQK
jgi:uncharacterized membrane protein